MEVNKVCEDDCIEFIKISKRAVRRHHYRRLKKKRQHYWISWPLTGASLGICVNTPANCSGPCCGNPRRHFGTRTVQERRSIGVGDIDERYYG